MNPDISFTGLLIVALIGFAALPALAFRGEAGSRRVAGAALLQATLLPIAPTQIGLELGFLPPATGAALIAAGLISVIAFPPLALTLIRPQPSSVSSTTVMETHPT